MSKLDLTLLPSLPPVRSLTSFLCRKEEEAAKASGVPTLPLGHVLPFHPFSLHYIFDCAAFGRAAVFFFEAPPSPDPPL